MIVEILALASAVAGQCPPANEADVRQEFGAWVRAYQAHDLAGARANFAPEGRVEFQGAPHANSSEPKKKYPPEVRFEFEGAPDASWSDLKQSYAQEFARQSSVGWVPHWDEIRVSGKIAAAFSQWQAFLTKPDGTKELRATNRSVDVLRRGTDCRWRIFRSLTYPVKPSLAAK